MDDGAQEYKYDVFVSYSHQDKEWVLTHLVPRLKETGFRVLVDRDFPAGRSAYDNMLEAVEQSRRTLLVLTSAWLESKWTEFEMILAATRDPSGRRRRLIPLRLEAVEIPKHLTHLTYREYTQKSEESWTSLVRDLAPASGEVQCRAVTAPEGPPDLRRAGLSALVQLMRDEAVRLAVRDFQEDFENARQKLVAIDEYKKLHDRLQDLEFPFDIIERHRAPLPQQESAWDDLGRDLPILRRGLQDLVDVAAGASISVQIERWTALMAGVGNDLQVALANSDHVLLGRACHLLRHILARQLSRVDTLLFARATELRFRDLLKALSTLRDNLPSAIDREVAEIFSVGVAALERDERRFSRLTHRHNQWQGLDDELRQLEMSFPELGLELLEYQWHDLARKIAELCGEPPDTERADPLSRAVKELSSALSNQVGESRIKNLFRSLRSEARHRFNQLDRELLDLCSNLRTCDEPLARLRRTYHESC